MLARLLNAQISRFERTWSYDAGYLRQLLATSPMSVLKFSLVSSMIPPNAAPEEAIAAAAIAATLSEDCGACVQIAVDKAAAAGVSSQVLRAILAGDPPAMGEAAALAWRFSHASLARDIESSERLRTQIRARWGERGLAAIALALTTARLYPTLKYALGYGHICTQVVVGDIVCAPGRQGKAHGADA